MQTSKGVQTTVEERATGHQSVIQSQYVVACDGARSAVRSHLGVESEGEDSCKCINMIKRAWQPTIADETMMTIHFYADLRAIVGDRVGMLHWIMDPLASGFIIAYDLSGNAVLISNFEVTLVLFDFAKQALTVNRKVSTPLRVGIRSYVDK